MKSVLSIAGSDSSGGAGIQADIKTITALGAYAQSAVSVLTAQNTTGVSGAFNVDSDFLQKQIDAVFDDIVPNAIKIGILGIKANVDVVAQSLQKYNAKHIVVDPVMVATSGSSLANDEVITATRDKLFPLAQVITPNIFEAQVLAGFEITNKELQEKAGHELLKFGSEWVLIKGGDLSEDNETSDDLLIGKDGSMHWLSMNRLQTKNTHGTGCSLSSAIASALSFGYNAYDACIIAKKYVYHAIKEDLELGRGTGPINHMWPHINKKREIHFLFEHMLEKADKEGMRK